MLDVFSSIWKYDFEIELKFVFDMIDDLKIDNVNGRIRVGVVVFSNRMRNIVVLNIKRINVEFKR